MLFRGKPLPNPMLTTAHQDPEILIWEGEYDRLGYVWEIDRIKNLPGEIDYAYVFDKMDIILDKRLILGSDSHNQLLVFSPVEWDMCLLLREKVSRIGHLIHLLDQLDEPLFLGKTCRATPVFGHRIE